LWIGASPIILASKSASRRALLAGVGVPFEVEAADIDERGVEEALSQRGEAPSGLALALARAKALSVSARRPEALTLGADQTLILDGQPMHKAPTRAAAAVALQAMSGRGHRLVSAFALARDGMILAEDSDSADMTMRALDAAQIARYLDIAGPAVLASVGAYQIEGLGAHLFESISGDQATILGLPMLKLLAALRGLGLLAL
jgi:septum formation protein